MLRTIFMVDSLQAIDKLEYVGRKHLWNNFNQEVEISVWMDYSQTEKGAKFLD